MSQFWKIKLTPLDAYFLGGERNADFGNSKVQLSEQKPYFIRSNRMLSQSAAFGVLRYLGIRSPQVSFRLAPVDEKNIGKKSYSLTEKREDYGCIRSISPVLLTDENDCQYLTAPLNRTGAHCNKKTGIGTCRPFLQYRPVQTMDVERWLPDEYEEKEACDSSDLICLETGQIHTSPFSTQVRTGINRASQRLPEEERKKAPSGYFKKEYVVLKDGFSFLFYAETKDNFFVHRDTVVYIGQGRTPFAAHVEQVRQRWDISLPESCYPAGRAWESATVLSDLYYPGHTRELREGCSLMIAYSRDHRCMETNYNAQHAGERYTKNTALKLIPAGSVFLFCGEDRAQRLADFRTKLEKMEGWNRARIAGFNNITYSIDTKNGGN